MTTHQDMVSLLDILNAVIQQQAQELTRSREHTSQLLDLQRATEEEVRRLQAQVEEQSHKNPWAKPDWNYDPTDDMPSDDYQTDRVYTEDDADNYCVPKG